MSAAARLHARPRAVTGDSPAGRFTLDAIGGTRDSYLYVPPQYRADKPAPLVLLLHGAGGHAADGLALLRHLADDAGMILVAPASAGHTWDIIARRTYGPDVALLDSALEHVFGQYAVDTAQLAIGGFSDGASYALTLGLANGDLFTHVIAFSPGFIGPVQPEGEPKIFISHGTRDTVLPVAPCSRQIVARLRRAEYSVMYDEFEGGHEIPAVVGRFATDWFLGRV